MGMRIAVKLDTGEVVIIDPPPPLSAVVLEHFYGAELAGLGCSCGHDYGQHHDGAVCKGTDSYQCPCECPSFELCQSDQEQLDPETDGDGR